MRPALVLIGLALVCLAALEALSKPLPASTSTTLSTTKKPEEVDEDD